MRLLPRVCFTLLASVALASVLGGAGCTHRGTPSPLPSGSGVPTARTVYVNAKTGNDKNNGDQSTPFKTVTRAIAVAASPGAIPVTDVEIAAGDYNAANGEKFPLTIPVGGLTINGSLYGRGQSRGSFVDGAGDDTALEKVLGVAAGSYYTTFVVPSTLQGSVSITNLYVGATSPKLPLASTVYDSIDLMGGLSATTSAFETSAKRGIAKLNGILLPGGTLNCTSCAIGGTGWAIAAFSLPTSDCTSAMTQCPTVTLTGPSNTGPGQIGARTGIRTDGSALITASNQAFTSYVTAFADDYTPIVSGIAPQGVDFGQGPGTPQSTGGNVFLGAHATEIALGLAGDFVAAFGDTWNTKTQGTGGSGQYRSDVTFKPGASGLNVTIASSATGAKVKVGPFKHATPTPSASPSGSPSASPTASPTPTP
jgi:hypothetical protein